MGQRKIVLVVPIDPHLAVRVGWIMLVHRATPSSGVETVLGDRRKEEGDCRRSSW